MIVDIHNHVGGYSPERLDVRTRDRLKIVGIDPEDQLRSLVRTMDECGIDITGVIGPSNPDEMKRYSNRLFGISPVRIVDGKPNIEKFEYNITSLGYKALGELVSEGARSAPIASGRGARAFFFPSPNNFERMDPVYKKAIDLDVPTMWHAHPGLIEVIRKYPELKVVICHLEDQAGNPIELAKTYPNVYIEASAVITHWMWRVMPPLSFRGPPEMEKLHTLNRNWSFMNSDKIEKTKKPYTSKDPRMMEAWRKVREKHQVTIRSCAHQCPNKFMFATDSPFASRADIMIPLYLEALADDKKLLNNVMVENAQKLFRL